MKMKELHIEEIPSYVDSSGNYRGKIKFSGNNGVVEIHLNHERIKKILAVVADALVETSKDVAENLTAEIINQVPMLEGEVSDD